MNVIYFFNWYGTFYIDKDFFYKILQRTQEKAVFIRLPTPKSYFLETMQSVILHIHLNYAGLLLKHLF